MKKPILFTAVIFLFAISLLAGPGSVIQRIASPSPCATGLAFDGKAFWTVDRDSDKLYRIDPVDGKVLADFAAPGYFCTALAWDGKNLWVADMDFTNTAAEAYSGKIYQIDAQTGRTLKVIMAPGADPQGLAWDGAYLWVSDNGTQRDLPGQPRRRDDDQDAQGAGGRPPRPGLGRQLPLAGRPFPGRTVPHRARRRSRHHDPPRPRPLSLGTGLGAELPVGLRLPAGRDRPSRRLRGRRLYPLQGAQRRRSPSPTT